MTARFAIFSLAIGVLLSTTIADAANCPPGASGSCIEQHPGPGCGNPVCCNQVCEVILACCESSWDEICVEVANQVCSNVACPSEGSCFVPHGGRGCSDYTCCAFICSLDGFCCFARWDEWCASEAAQLCPPTACSLVVPPGAVDEIEPCNARLNDGCNLVSAPVFSITGCGTTFTGVCSTGAPRDTDWWSFFLNAPTQVTFLLSAEFPAEGMIVRGPCDRTSTLARIATAECGTEILVRTLAAGQYWFVVSTATAVRPINSGVPCEDGDPKTPPPFLGVRYVATMSCAPPPPSADLNGDGVVDGADLGLLLGAWDSSGSAADLNGDGTVDGADLGALLGAWTG